MIEAAEEADVEDAQEDEPPEELYTTLNTEVVGVQYYEGCVRRSFCWTHHIDGSDRPRRIWGTGEAPTGANQSIRPVSSFDNACTRQSDQQFRNAIRVLNINNIQVGHVPKATAAKLAPLLDQGKVTIEGTMLEGNSGSSVSHSDSSMADHLQ